MNKTVKRILIGVVVLVAIVALVWPKLPSSDEEAGVVAGPSRTLRVSSYVVQPEVLRDRIYATGTIRANEEVELRGETSGKITGIFFTEGRAVRRGQLLVKVNDSELQAQLRKAAYRLELAQTREQRQKQLLYKGGISQDDYEGVLNELNVLHADVELIKAQITKTEVHAPFNGVIGLRYASEGSYITPSTPIAALQDVNPIKIDFAIPEKYAARVKVGDEIFFNVEGLGGPFRGQIYAFEPKIEADTRTLLLRARSPNPNARLLPGAFASIELVFNEIPEALTVPAIALVPELGGQKVYVYENGQAVPRPVQTGIRTEARVQITDGLTANDTVITSGLQQLRPMLPVELAD